MTHLKYFCLYSYKMGVNMVYNLRVQFIIPK
jgi:hypothetical protein